jgi:hypothetical protein
MISGFGYKMHYKNGKDEFRKLLFTYFVVPFLLFPTSYATSNLVNYMAS